VSETCRVLINQVKQGCISLVIYLHDKGFLGLVTLDFNSVTDNIKDKYLGVKSDLE